MHNKDIVDGLFIRSTFYSDKQCVDFSFTMQFSRVCLSMSLRHNGIHRMWCLTLYDENKAFRSSMNFISNLLLLVSKETTSGKNYPN